MKRFLVFALLSASLLAGCGQAPFAAPTTALSPSAAAASARETGGQVQIYDAFQRVDALGNLRLVIMYWVRHADRDREFRQVILDSAPTQDRAMYRSGYRAMEMVANGFSMLEDEARLMKTARELASLNHHTITKEQQRLVALAYDIVMDRIH